MAISIKTIVCPQCGASVNYEEGHEKLFCSYCGVPIVISNENEHIYRHIDEADITRAETERIETIADIKNIKTSNIVFYVKLIAIGILITLGLVLMIISMYSNLSFTMPGLYSLLIAGFIGTSCMADNSKNRKKAYYKNSIRVTSAIADAHGKNYESIASIMKSVGFSNITCVPMNDLNLFTLKKKGQIESLVIDGENDIKEGDYYSATAAVVITYHSFPSRST